MSTFRENLRVVPTAAWIIAWFIYACFTLPLFFFAVPTDPDIGRWPRWGQALFVFGIFLFVVALVVFIGYVYGDAKRRGMNAIGWTLLSIFVPYLIGVIIYFCVRDPLPADCPSCHQTVPAKYVFCPSCGKALRPHCPQCGKAAERNWANCGFCGTKLPA